MVFILPFGLPGPQPGGGVGVIAISLEGGDRRKITAYQNLLTVVLSEAADQ